MIMAGKLSWAQKNIIIIIIIIMTLERCGVLSSYNSKHPIEANIPGLFPGLLLSTPFPADFAYCLDLLRNLKKSR